MLLASDYSALLEHTRRMTFLDENQAALLTAGRHRHLRRRDRRAAGADDHRGDLVGRGRRSPGLPGLHEQGDPRAAARPAPDRPRAPGRRRAPRRPDPQTPTRPTWSGCGTAAHAALAGQYLLARVAGRRAFYANGSEFGYLENFLGPRALAIALSQSGETIDVIDSVRSAKAARRHAGRAGQRRRLHAVPPGRSRRSCSGPGRSAACWPPRALPPSWRSC